MPSRFEDLDIETIILVTNYLDRNEVAYEAGPLRPAVAGSMAIPGLFRPVLFGESARLGGDAVNQLPYDLLFSLADIVVAVDVTLGEGRQSDELHRRLRPCLAPRKSYKEQSRLKKSNARAGCSREAQGGAFCSFGLLSGGPDPTGR
jgi:predicted acylesterase/phospholipase RssA